MGKGRIKYNSQASSWITVWMVVALTEVEEMGWGEVRGVGLDILYLSICGIFGWSSYNT